MATTQHAVVTETPVEDLKQVEQKLNEREHIQVVSCHKALIQIKLRYTEYKQVTINIQFTEDYPATPLIVELKSKTIPDKLLRGLENVCTKELKNHLHKPQVVQAIDFICDFIGNNPFMVCSDEVSYVKSELVREGDEVKVKHKAGAILYKAREGNYFIDFKIQVPNEYPAYHVNVDIRDCNLPPNIMQFVRSQSAEILRQCVEPPLMRKPSDPPYQPSPSLRTIVDYLVLQCVRNYPRDHCPVCSKLALPTNPKDVVLDDSDPLSVHRVYCGHLYHHSCLDKYMKKPPFTGGKKCPTCNQRIFHDKWNVPPKLAEDRWAHQEAKKREISEVADFLGID